MFPLVALTSLALTLVPAFSTAATLATRQVSSPCSRFTGGFDSLANFTLAALNTTLPNANNTGAPLVLGPGGAIESEELEFLTTWATWQFNQWPSLTLTKGGLTANQDPPQSTVPTSSGGPSNGSEIFFVTTSLNPPTPAPVFCGLANTDPEGGSSPYPQLAVYGHADLFSLCLTSTLPDAFNSVIYNATADNFGTYVFESCYPVTLMMVTPQ
ncbi:hypothetical protein K439DRAFT_677543 [Ramaria rubella]|nr:hypothetical protein K439DRAFT_677543 [Ramaria rubella]